MTLDAVGRGLNPVGMLNHYSLPDQDGLNLPWLGRVWMNPPYGTNTGTWLQKLSDHNHGTCLIFARTETKMFQQWIWDKATAILFIYNRLYFYHNNGMRGETNSGAPSCLVAYGLDDANRLENSGIEGKFLRLKIELW